MWLQLISQPKQGKPTKSATNNKINRQEHTNLTKLEAVMSNAGSKSHEVDNSCFSCPQAASHHLL